MARIDETRTKPGNIVDGETNQPRAGCARYGDMHVGCGVEIVVGDVDVLAAGSRLWTDEQPRLVLIVQPIQVVCFLGDPPMTLEINEIDSSWMTIARSIDVSWTGGQERAGQTLGLSEIDRLIARSAVYAGHCRWPIKGKLFGPSVAAIP